MAGTLPLRETAHQSSPQLAAPVAPCVPATAPAAPPADQALQQPAARPLHAAAQPSAESQLAAIVGTEPAGIAVELMGGCCRYTAALRKVSICAVGVDFLRNASKPEAPCVMLDLTRQSSQELLWYMMRSGRIVFT